MIATCHLLNSQKALNWELLINRWQRHSHCSNEHLLYACKEPRQERLERLLRQRVRLWRRKQTVRWAKCPQRRPVGMHNRLLGKYSTNGYVVLCLFPREERQYPLSAPWTRHTQLSQMGPTRHEESLRILNLLFGPSNRTSEQKVLLVCS